MKPDPTKVQAISEIPTTIVTKQVFVVYWEHLRELLKADVHFQWNSAAENALTSIKRILLTQPVL